RLVAQFAQSLALFHGQVGNDEAVESRPLGIGDQRAKAVGKQRVVIGKQDQRHLYSPLPGDGDHLPQAVQCHSLAQGPPGRLLDHRTVGQRIRKGKPHFHRRRSLLIQQPQQGHRRFHVGIPRHDKGDQPGSPAPLKRFPNPLHPPTLPYAPPSSPRPCLPGRTNRSERSGPFRPLWRSSPLPRRREPTPAPAKCPPSGTAGEPPPALPRPSPPCTGPVPCPSDGNVRDPPRGSPILRRSNGPEAPVRVRPAGDNCRSRAAHRAFPCTASPRVSPWTGLCPPLPHRTDGLPGLPKRRQTCRSRCCP